MDANTLKQLKVKVGSLKRNVKDIEYAEKELEKEQKRLAEYEATNDADKIFQQKKVLDEVNQMIPINNQRLKTMFEEVSQFAVDLPPADASAENQQEQGFVPTAGDDEATTKKKQQDFDAEIKRQQQEIEGRDSLKEALESAKSVLKSRGIDVVDVAAQKVEDDNDDNY